MAVDVLALRAAGVGDLLTAVPALRALSDIHRAAGIAVAAPAWLHPLVGLIPGVTSAVEVDGLAPRRDLAGSLVFNLHGCGPQSHEALLSRRPRDLVAFHCPGVWEFGPQWWVHPEEPERERFCRLLSWVGIGADPDRVGIRRPAVDGAGDAIVLHVGGTDPQRRWPAASFGDLAGRLAGHDLLVTGGPADIVVAQQAAHLGGIPHDRVLAGRVGLDGLAAVIADARLVVSGDTGAAHLAHAYGVPSVVVFGPASPGQWGPPADVPSVVLRADGPVPAAADVPVAEVEKAVVGLLERT